MLVHTGQMNGRWNPSCAVASIVSRMQGKWRGAPACGQLNWRLARDDSAGDKDGSSRPSHQSGPLANIAVENVAIPQRADGWEESWAFARAVGDVAVAVAGYSADCCFQCCLGCGHTANSPEHTLHVQYIVPSIEAFAPPYLILSPHALPRDLTCVQHLHRILLLAHADIRRPSRLAKLGGKPCPLDGLQRQFKAPRHP